MRLGFFNHTILIKDLCVTPQQLNNLIGRDTLRMKGWVVFLNEFKIREKKKMG
jgi:hypothetical protein